MSESGVNGQPDEHSPEIRDSGIRDSCLSPVSRQDRVDEGARSEQLNLPNKQPSHNGVTTANDAETVKSNSVPITSNTGSVSIVNAASRGQLEQSKGLRECKMSLPAAPKIELIEATEVGYFFLKI